MALRYAARPWARRMVGGACWWAAALILTACGTDEFSVLLAAASQGDVETLQVTVIPVEGNAGAQRTGEVPVNRSQADIAADPIRIGIDLEEAGVVMIHLNARGPGDARLVATRCYRVAGVVRDEVLLAALTPEDDRDGDGFPRDPAVACLAMDGSPCPVEDLCPVDVAGDCADDEPICTDSDTYCVEPDAVFPGAPPVCMDGIDQDCNGEDEPCLDEDGDGWRVCSATDLAMTCDCDDRDPNINPTVDESPENTELCGDGIDQDCSGSDAKCDRDGDGFPAGRLVGGTPDCDDSDPTINPQASEQCTEEGGTPQDEDCDGLVDELSDCTPDDLDRDGFDDCRVAEGPDCDCNDCDPGIHPGVSRDACGDAVDQDCSGSDLPCSPEDQDRDNTIGTALGGTDCDDRDPRTFPGAPELCGDGSAQSCREDVSCDADLDGDGYVEPEGCEGNADITPWQEDTCNGVDDDCDGVADEVLLQPLVSTSGVTLSQGERGCIIATPREDCDPGTSCDVSFRESLFHCGGCRVACNGDDNNIADVCVDGACDCSTEPGSAPCGNAEAGNALSCCPQDEGEGGGCKDLLTDFENCGACNNSCAEDDPLGRDQRSDSCVDGGCACGTGAPCAADERCCGGQCVPRGDRNHCGACGQVCGANSNCVSLGSDAFMCRCVSPFLDCNGNIANGCEVDPRTNLNNCGGCGRRCQPANAAGVCRSSTCGIQSCNTGFDNCNSTPGDGCETPLNTLANCGSCGTACSLANATESCATRSCLIQSCNTGFDDCNSSPGDGCETPLNTLTNCGSCGTACSLANATESCATRSCLIQSCNTGFDDCNSSPGDGCETQLGTLANCQSCGDNCTAPANATATCESSGCAWTCNAGFMQCGNTCIDVSADVNNCGGCGVTCGAAEVCAGGRCECGPSQGGVGAGAVCGASETCCAATGGCVDTDTSATNCGACATSCGANETCSAGACCCGTDCGTAAAGEHCTGATDFCCAAMNLCVADMSACM